MTQIPQDSTPDPSIPPHWQKDQLRPKNYDGIQLFDNPIPLWWTLLFSVALSFGLLYFLFYHIGVPDRSLKDEYAEAYAADIRKRFATMGELTVNEPNLLAWMKKPEYMAVGESTFKQNCVSCHGPEGQGQIGPNLTDDYYKNVRSLTDLVKVISNGAANGNMPSWAGRLHPNEIALTAAYIAAMRGKNIAGPRGIEGDKIAPWPVSADHPASTTTAPK